MTVAATVDTLAQLEWLAEQGAQFALPYGRTKDKFSKNWPNTPHTLEDASTHAQRGGNVGILTGKHSNAIVAVDRDVEFAATVEMLGPLAQTAKIIRDNALDRGKLLYRIAGPLPRSTVWKAQADDAHPSAEFLSTGRHALCPPSEFDGGHYVLQDMERGILKISPEQADRVWWLITGTALIEPFKAKPNGAGAEDGYIERVKAHWTAFDVFKHFNKFTESQPERGGNLRLLGNGGLFVGDPAGPEPWRWYCHAAGVGGDALDAWSWCEHGHILDRNDAQAFFSIIDAMAAAAGIAKPQVHVNGHSERTAEAEAGPQTYTGATVPLGDDVHDAPPLPAYAQLSQQERVEAIPTGVFLKEYMHFAHDASPMTPAGFHVAMGLSLVSMAIARRVHVQVGATKIYPNLYTLYVGRSTVDRKTTGLNIGTGLANAAGMVPAFTLAERQTPEALFEDWALSLPRTYQGWTPQAQEAWLKRRGLAAQRAWFLDEASHLLDSFNRDYSSGLLPIVLDMYDSKDRPGERNTKSYGLEMVENVYLTIFGCTTHAALSEHMTKAVHWNNGLWARFALVTSNAASTWQFWPEPLKYPDRLVNGLRRIAFRLFGPPPSAILVEDDKPDSQENKGRPELVIQVDDLPDHVSQFGPGAWDAWERYAKAVGFDMLRQAEADDSIDQSLFANYGRFPTMLIKVAMLLAAMDAEALPVVIERKHVFSAQDIIEAWRDNLHQVRAQARISEQKTKLDEVRALLARNGENWTTRRDLLRSLNCAWSDLELVVKDLEAMGEIEVTSYQPKRGPKGEKYRLNIGDYT